MSNFAVIDENLVINTIICDSKELAEQVTGKTCVEITGNLATKNATVGATYADGVFLHPKPFPSWRLTEDNSWRPPVLMPEPEPGVSFIWDESITNWVEN